ncbi:WW domain-binding protein 11-like [Actinia tenebrosa]|uniref:WW domain-binding protein 11-like n=1 Tax=Actinia tenebrosa TaxID=6105 RepID=A0A6P8HYL4_ACTTE|nr:WW domain-binding protein 11-like [Actinia tenebrosa]
MGRRSTSTTKNGKFMNPTDQARKEARKRELKKNKKQRKMVREAVLKTKDPKRILDEIEKIETVELDAGVEPLPNDKALKDKKKKLRETLERLQKLFEKSDPKKAGEIQKLLNESEKRREHLQIEAYESMHAKLQAEQFANIPLPTNIPLPHSGMLMPSDIPLPGPLPGQQTLPPGLIPPGPPPGEPPVPSTGTVSSATATDKSKLLHPPGVSDADHEGLEEKGDDVDYDDDGSSTSESGLDEDEYQQEMKIGDYAKMDTQDFKDDKTQDQHHRSVRFADEATDPNKPVSQSDDPRSAVQRALLKIAGIADGNKQKNSQTSDQRPTPPGPPPGPRGMTSVQPNSQIPPPPTHLFPPGPPPRGPPGPPPRMPGGMPPGPPPGMPPGPPPGMPPGPPPGMPPNMAAQVMGRGPRPLMQQPMMPPGPPPRMPRPPGPPPPHMMSGQGSVLSAPPSVIRKPPMAHLPGDASSGGILKKTPGVVISAKPQIRNTQAELTKLVPTSLRVKREAPKQKPKGKDTLENMPSQEPRRPEQNISGRATKDDAYALFMKEMEGLL